MKLNISKFKKIKTEKDHTVLKHPDGHEIRVLHKPLSQDVKSQLDELPHYSDGGKVTDNNPKLDQAYKSDKEPVSQSSAQSVADSFNSMGVPHKVKPLQDNLKGFKFADGGPVLDPNKAGQAQESLRKAFHFDEGGKPVIQGEEQPVRASRLESAYGPEEEAAQETVNQLPSEQINSELANIPDSHAHLAEAVRNLSQKYSGNPQSPQEDTSEAEPAPVASPEAPSPSPAVPMAPSGTLPQQAKADVEQANKAEMSAAGNIQNAEAEKAKVFGEQGANMEQLRQKYDEIGHDLHQQFDNVAKEVHEGKIDPNHWWNSKSTGSKIFTAIGMLFSGAGGGIAGHPELASEAINTAISRDIDSQKANLANKNSLLSKYLEMYRSLPEAEAAARLTMNAAAEGLINQQAAKLGSDNALNAARMTIAQRRQALLPQMEGLAKGQVMSQMYNEMGNAKAQPTSAEQAYQDRMQNMRVLNPDLGKDMENKYLPGVGASRVPVPDKLREELSTRKDLSDKLAQLELYAKKHSGSLDPATVAQGKAMAAQVQDAYRTAHQQGVFKESEKNFLESVLHSDPTAFWASARTLPGYRQARKFNDDTVKQYYKSYGIKPFSGEQQGSSESGQTATMGGVQYRKVPGGWERIQ